MADLKAKDEPMTHDRTARNTAAIPPAMTCVARYPCGSYSVERYVDVDRLIPPIDKGDNSVSRVFTDKDGVKRMVWLK